MLIVWTRAPRFRDRARTILEQKQLIGAQARTNADSAAGAVQHLQRARRIIESQAQEHAALMDTIARLRGQMIPGAAVQAGFAAQQPPAADEPQPQPQQEQQQEQQ